MAERSNRRTGGQILVDALKLHGVDTIFSVPGESYLATLDALHDAQNDINLVICRQEGGAAYMADAYSKLTGKPGICFVTRGPGATNASVGLHTARQDSSSVILFVGQVARSMADREAFQEIDFRRMYGQMAKWVSQIDDPARIPEMVGRAFYTATSGRHGPVVLALPEDMQTERAEAEDGITHHAVQAHPGAADMARLRELLAAAKRPLLVLGGSGWTETACAEMRRFAERNHLAAAVTFRRQDLFDNLHPNYAGVIGIGTNAALAKRVDESDLLIVVGAQLGEIVTSGYTTLTLPHPKQTLVHVCAGAEELGKVYQPDLPILSGPAEFADAAVALEPVDAAAWNGEAATAHEAFMAFSTPPAASGHKVDLAAIVGWLSDVLPDDAIVANGAGNFSIWVHRFYRYRRFATQLAPQSGSMGYGTPAGVAAGIVHPDRIVVSVSGDGCYMMNGQELATAVQYGLKIVFVVVNNGMYGTIRMHQERHYPGRISGTPLGNPDFAALARAYGAHGETVERTEDFAAAFERCREAAGPGLIDLRVDPDVSTPAETLTAIREKALAKK